jgi:hypothetical protein
LELKPHLLLVSDGWLAKTVQLALLTLPPNTGLAL